MAAKISNNYSDTEVLDITKNPKIANSYFDA